MADRQFLEQLSRRLADEGRQRVRSAKQVRYSGLSPGSVPKPILSDGTVELV